MYFENSTIYIYVDQTYLENKVFLNILTYGRWGGGEKFSAYRIEEWGVRHVVPKFIILKVAIVYFFSQPPLKRLSADTHTEPYADIPGWHFSIA
jgi:hypothetical protein